MPKLTNKGLARKALKTIAPKTVEPIQEANQLKSECTEASEVQQNGAKGAPSCTTGIAPDSLDNPAKLSKIEREIAKAEQLLALSNRAEETATETSRFIPVGGQRSVVDISEVHKTSIDKHVESMRFKIVWVANKLADELIHETSKKTKKDKEYIKGLVWSFGTMYDKLANISTDTVQVHIPTKLLEGVKSAISIQIARVQQIDQTLRSIPEAQPPIDVTPIRSTPDVAMRSDSVIATSTYDNHAEGVPSSDNNTGITT
jgi:hypothetical protein